MKRLNLEGFCFSGSVIHVWVLLSGHQQTEVATLGISWHMQAYMYV